MPELPFNLLDILAVLLIIGAVMMGIRSGLVVQALALAGFAGGVLILILLAPHAAELLGDVDPPLRGLLAVGAIAAIVLIAQSVGSSAGVAIRRAMGAGVLSGVDSGAGGVFGLARGIFLVWLLGGLLAVVPNAAIASEARQSLVLRVLETRLPSPVILATELGRIIEAAGLPEVFVGPAPPAAPPVDGTTLEEAQAIAEPARESTLRVEAIACARVQTGTAFAVGPQHFVTNAHVVAGATRIQLSFDGAFERFAANVVHFDPSLDVALVHSPDLDIDPLALAESAPARGEPAAALGFTGGGRQRVVPAAISRSLDALGRDIYGRGTVSRPVIEMRADVAPGDSGGPLVLGDGTIGGVTFSESRDDRAIGYALAPQAVAGSIAGARDRSRPVETGECLPSGL